MLLIIALLAMLFSPSFENATDNDSGSNVVQQGSGSGG
jgi:hypothetical protein